MAVIALRMLFGDRAKYLGLVFGVAFATLLVTQQGGLFVGLMTRTSSVIADVREADIWVMDPQAAGTSTPCGRCATPTSHACAAWRAWHGRCRCTKPPRR